MYGRVHNYHSLAVISRRKAGAFRHVGVLLPDGRVVHCAPGRGEHISTGEDFAAGQDVAIVRIVEQPECAATLQRIAAALRSPKPYDAATNNCEMFANRMIGQNPVSPQLGATLCRGCRSRVDRTGCLVLRLTALRASQEAACFRSVRFTEASVQVPDFGA